MECFHGAYLTKFEPGRRSGSALCNDLSEVLQGGGFGFEGGDGFDEAGDGEGVADAAVATDQAEHAAFAGELDGDAHQRGDAGAVDLGNAAQDDDNFLGAALNYGLESVVELVRRLADSEPSVNFKYRDSAGFANVDFHGKPVSHGSVQSVLVGPGWPFAMPHGIIRWRVSYTK